MYGYFPNAAKTWLIVKPERLDEAKQPTNTGVSITVEGKRHLGAALGSRAFTEAYITEKDESWSRCVRRLVNIAKTHSHAAYAAFTHGLCSKWTYFVRTIPAISSLLEPLEDIISLQLLPALTGRSISDVERALFSLPVGLGGVYSTERNGTERNDGLNCGTECFLRLKLAAYHCCTSYQWHFQQVIKCTPRKIKRI